MNGESKIKANIKKFYLITALAAFGFYIPISQLFYLNRGLTVFDIAMLGVVWTVVKMILEVPSSILADRWGRKKVLLISTIFAIMQLVTIILAKNFELFVLASVWSAAAYAFMSGTDVAFFYDSLKAQNREADFDKLWAKKQIYSQVPFVISFLASGLLFEISPVLPYWLSLIFLMLSVALIFALVEPKFYSPVEEELKLLSHFKQSVVFIFKDMNLRFVLLFILLFSLGSDISYGYGQIYLKYVSLPVIMFGFVYTLKSFVCTFAANMIPFLRKKFSFQTIFGVQIIGMTLAYYIMVLTSNFWIAALTFVLIAIPHGFFEITKSSYLHQRIQSHQRATIDSMFSFIIAAMFLIIEPVVGLLADRFSIKIPFLGIGVILSIYCIYYLVAGHKKLDKAK